MMLLKPNRDYYKDPSHVYYDYHKYDFLDKMLAISMLDDEDQEDLVLPQGEYKEQMRECATVLKGERSMVSAEELKEPDTAFFREDDHQNPIQSRIRSDDKEDGEPQER